MSQGGHICLDLVFCGGSRFDFLEGVLSQELHAHYILECGHEKNADDREARSNHERWPIVQACKGICSGKRPHTLQLMAQLVLERTAVKGSASEGLQYSRASAFL